MANKFSILQKYSLILWQQYGWFLLQHHTLLCWKPIILKSNNFFQQMHSKSNENGSWCFREIWWARWLFRHIDHTFFGTISVRLFKNLNQSNSTPTEVFNCQLYTHVGVLTVFGYNTLYNTVQSGTVHYNPVLLVHALQVSVWILWEQLSERATFTAS